MCTYIILSYNCYDDERLGGIYIYISRVCIILRAYYIYIYIHIRMITSKSINQILARNYVRVIEEVSNRTSFGRDGESVESGGGKTGGSTLPS